MSAPAERLRGFRTLCITVGVVYVLLALSMVLRGVHVMSGFAVPDDLVASPVFDDFFRFFYELMAIMGVLIALLGHVTTEARHQRLVAAVLAAINVAITWRDVSTSDSALGNRLYRGPGTLAPVVIDLVIALAFGFVALRGAARAPQANGA
jgi:hypothetical protein